MSKEFNPKQCGEKTTFREKKIKVQNFYDNWMKPVKSVMSLQMLSDMEDMIKKYSLVR